MFVLLLDARVGDNFSQARGDVVEVDDAEGLRLIEARLAAEVDPADITATLAGADLTGPTPNIQAVKAVTPATDGPQVGAQTPKPKRPRGGRKPKDAGANA